MSALCDFVGKRVALKEDHTGTINNAFGFGYTTHVAKAGEKGKVVSSYWIEMDNGIKIYCMGNDFEDPDEQFKRLFDLI